MPPKKKDVVKEGDEKEMGGILLRAVKGNDGKIVFKPASQLDAKAQAKPPDEKKWLQDKQRAVVDARVQERRQTESSKKKASADIYGRDEIYQRSGGGGKGSGGKGRSSRVEVPSYLQDLRMEEQQARAANLHVSRPGQYQIIKESLDVEEAKFNQVSLKLREKAYQRSQRRHGVYSNKEDAGGDDSDEAEHEMTEEEFERLAKARAKAADNELARDGVKLRAPIPKREEEEAKARAKLKDEEDRRDRRHRQKGEKGNKSRNPEPKSATAAYCHPRSAEAQAAAAAEANKWAELKDQSEEIKLVGDKRPESRGKGEGRRRNKGKGKGSSSKGGGGGGGRGGEGGRNSSGRGLI